ncbi:NAD(P)H-binding protein [Gordonia sp. CPCC 205515]|uniref:NmrA family NAD(P)-binding protein n=1 Tax=Gordonia sp. CPCC 205515 TaxID=3140791 RepID=UPI003AF3A725
MTTILICGGTGRVGAHLVAELLVAGHRPRVLVRDPAHAPQDWRAAGVDLVIGDFTDAKSLATAVRGVDRLFLTSADGPTKVADETAVIHAAVRSGIRRIVRLSAMHAQIGSTLPAFDWHGQIDYELDRSEVPYTLLRPAFFVDNLLMVAPGVAATGHLASPTAGARAAMIDVRDVAASAAAALLTDGPLRADYDLTGPQAITFVEVAAALSEATGQDIVFDDLTPEQAAPRFSGAGLPDWLAAQLSGAFALLRAGGFDVVADGVPALTGRPATTVRAWADTHAAAFGPATELASDR